MDGSNFKLTQILNNKIVRQLIKCILSKTKIKTILIWKLQCVYNTFSDNESMWWTGDIIEYNNKIYESIKLCIVSCEIIDISMNLIIFVLDFPLANQNWILIVYIENRPLDKWFFPSFRSFRFHSVFQHDLSANKIHFLAYFSAIMNRSILLSFNSFPNKCVSFLDRNSAQMARFRFHYFIKIHRTQSK